MNSKIKMRRATIVFARIHKELYSNCITEHICIYIPDTMNICLNQISNRKNIKKSNYLPMSFRHCLLVTFTYSVFTYIY